MRLYPTEARARFSSGRTAHLATVDERGRPRVVVITFAVHGDLIVTAVDHKPKTTQNLARLRHIAANPSVSLLVDAYDDADWSELWWARADGTARVLTEPSDKTAPLDWLGAKYPQYQEIRPDGPVIQVAVERWTGWAATEAEGGGLGPTT